MSPAKHSSGGVTDGQTDRRTDRQTTDKVITMCRCASQATQQPFNTSSLSLGANNYSPLTASWFGEHISLSFI